MYVVYMPKYKGDILDFNIIKVCFFARPFCIKLQKLFVGRCSCIL